MKRSEWIRANVLNCIADDYESLDIILNDVRRVAPKILLPISEEDVLIGLRDLIEAGSAKAYLLSNRVEEISSAPLLNVARERWYYITPEGKGVLKLLPKELFSETFE